MATYSEIFTLSRDSAFLGKLEVAVTKYMDYILNESTATANHTKRWNWAVEVARAGSGSVSGRISQNVAFDSTIQANLGASTDAQIQAATEYWINRLLQF